MNESSTSSVVNASSTAASTTLVPGQEGRQGENDDEMEVLRRDPEEEYFMLAVLANKMIHSELYDPEYVYEINAKKLFGQVKQLKIPFHRWYQWLDAKFSQL